MLCADEKPICFSLLICLKLLYFTAITITLKADGYIFMDQDKVRQQKHVLGDRAVTIADIAARCSVSKATVSRVLRTPHIVRESTRILVQNALRESNYSYNAAAGDLARQRNSILGLIISGMTDTSFRGVVQSIQNTMTDHDLLIGDSNYVPYMEARLLRRFMERRTACVIMLGHCIGNEDIIREAEEAGTHCLMLWSKPDFDFCNYISYDSRLAIAQATDHLVQLGHTNIGMVVGPYDRVVGAQHRVEGLRMALEQHGLVLHPGHLVAVDTEFSPESGRVAMTRLLSTSPRPTGVILAGDILAVGAYAAAQQFGLRIPEDISLVTMDNIDFAPHMNPPLTTVHIPTQDMGRLAGQYLARLLKGEREKYQVCLPTALMARGSTAPPPKEPGTGIYLQQQQGLLSI